MATNEHGLTPKQEAFCLAYVECNVAKEAYQHAYNASRMTDQSISNNASLLLKNPLVAARVAALRAPAVEKAKLTVERVLIEMCRIAFFDIRKIFNEDGTLKRVVDLDDDTAAAVSGIEAIEIGTDGQLVLSKKIKAADKRGALEMLGRHLAMFNDKLKIEDERERMTDDDLRRRLTDRFSEISSGSIKPVTH